MRLRLLTLCCVLQFYLKYINKSSHCEEGDIEMSPSSMVEKRRSTESGSLRDNCKRTKSGASPLKDKIKIILAASSGSSIKECMAMVHNMEGIATGSQFYCYKGKLEEDIEVQARRRKQSTRCFVPLAC